MWSQCLFDSYLRTCDPHTYLSKVSMSLGLYVGVQSPCPRQPSLLSPQVRTIPRSLTNILNPSPQQALQNVKTSSPKGNNAHLRAIIQSEKKWKHQFFRRLRAASSVVGSGRNSNLSRLLCMSSLPVSMTRIPSRTEKKL